MRARKESAEKLPEKSEFIKIINYLYQQHTHTQVESKERGEPTVYAILLVKETAWRVNLSFHSFAIHFRHQSVSSLVLKCVGRSLSSSLSSLPAFRHTNFVTNFANAVHRAESVSSLLHAWHAHLSVAVWRSAMGVWRHANSRFAIYY
jgi:hypothetical protein